MQPSVSSNISRVAAFLGLRLDPTLYLCLFSFLSLLGEDYRACSLVLSLSRFILPFSSLLHLPNTVDYCQGVEKT